MTSSSMYPCIIQEFDHLLPLEASCGSSHLFAAKECALKNLNALQLRGSSIRRYAGGFLLTAPRDSQAHLPLGASTVGTWEQTPSRGRGPGSVRTGHQGNADDRPLTVDANCNNPEEHCQPCPRSPTLTVKGGQEAPPDGHSSSPASTPSPFSSPSPSSPSPSSSSTSSSPLSSSSDSEASPDALCRDVLTSSRPAGEPEEAVVTGSSPMPERAKVIASSPDSLPDSPASDQEPDGELTIPATIEPGPVSRIPPKAPVKSHSDVNQNLSPASQVLGPGSAGQPDPGAGHKPAAAVHRFSNADRPKASPREGFIGKRPSLQPQPPILLFSDLGQLALTEHRDAVSECPGQARATLSPFNEAPRPFPVTRTQDTQLMTFEDSPTYNKAQAEELRLGDKAQAEELRLGDKAQAEELRLGDKAQAEELRLGDKAQAEELRLGDKAQAEELRLGDKAQAEELRLGDKAKPEELHQGTKAQSVELRPGTKAQSTELRPGTKAQAVELRPGTKAQSTELRPGTKAQTIELRPGTKAQSVELRPGTKAQSVELRPGTKAQSTELRPGTKAQSTELRPGTKAQSTELRPGTKAQSTELRPGTKAQPDMRAPKNITSFHELAQKRRQSAAGQPATKAKEDKSDWLMAFSPDSELPPPPNALLQEQAGVVPESQGTWRQQKAVITFRELRYRNHVGRWSLPLNQSDTRCGSTRPTMRDDAQQGSEAGNQTPRTAAAKGSGKEDRGGWSANTGSTRGKTLSEAARGISDGTGTGQPRGQDLFNKPQSSADWDSSQDTAGRLSTRTFLRPGQVKGQSEARAEELASLEGGSDRTRGKADGRDKTIKEVGRSRSLPGRTWTEWCGMASTAMTPSLHTPFLEGSVPSDSPQQKRGLLWPVNVAVDKIVSNFSVARNIVQKAQLGDSRVNPSVGRLVLGDLCPALYTVLHDGLNLYQQDIILGRRPNSPWSVVEASVKAGPSLKPLYSLYYQLDQFSQLNNSQKKFNAFIFGLLNLKRLDFWISCLHSCREVLRTHYSPMAFLSLSHGSCRALFEELLLLLQPLSVFTFHLDPLFEYHHQFLADQGGLGSNTQPRGLDQKERHTTQRSGTQQRQGGLPMAASGQPPEGKEGLGMGLIQKSQPQGSSDRVEQVSYQREAVAEEARDRETTQCARAERSLTAQERQGGKAQPGYTLQQTFDQVIQWGDRLAQTLGDLNMPPAVVQQEPLTVPACSPLELVTAEAAAGVKRKPSWWNQLSQSSQVYLSTSQDSSVFAKWIKPKTTGSKTNSLLEPSGQEPSALKQERTGGTIAHERSGQVDNSVRVESAPQDTDHTGFNADCTVSPGPVAQKDSIDATNRKRSPDEQQDPTPCSRDPSDKLEEATLPATSPNSRPMASTSDLDRKAVFRLGDRLWLGRLFGAKVPCTYTPSDQPHREVQEARRGRLPSDWLQVNMTHFEQLLKVIPVAKERSPQLTEIIPPSQETSKSTRKVRTLCDHTATDEDHLSFRRGDTLEILACVDEDWIRCCHGDVTGLVPIGYTSLI